MCSPADDELEHPFFVDAAMLRIGVRRFEMGTILAQLPWCLEALLSFEAIVVVAVAVLLFGSFVAAWCAFVVAELVRGVDDLVAGSESVDMWVMIEREVSSSSRRECSLVFEFVVYDANLCARYNNNTK